MISYKQAAVSAGLVMLFFTILFSNIGFVAWSGGQKAWGASVAFMSWSVGLSMRDNIKTTTRGLVAQIRQSKGHGARALALAAFVASLIGAALFYGATPAHADYFNYPCQPPGTGTGVDVNIGVDASGQYCDGPTQVNLTHLHCESGGAKINIGALALTGMNGVSVGGLGGSGTGASGQGCSYRCPDNTIAPQPNPPWSGSTIPFLDVNRIIKANRAFCVVGHHLLPAGPTSALVRPEEGDPDMYHPEPDLIPQPVPPPAPEGEAPEPEPPHDAAPPPADTATAP